MNREDVVEKYNEKYAVVNYQNTIRFWDGKGLMKQHDFRALTRPDTLWEGVGNGPRKPVPYFDVWYGSPNRRFYKDVVFNPNGTSADVLNTYEGLAFKPVKGDWSLFQEHLFENVCGGRADYHKWLISWMSDIVQNPGIKRGTAVVVRGLKGSGKTIFAEIFGKLFGKHAVTLSNGSQVTASFNKVYEETILMIADEAIWAGDKKNEGVLKNIISAEKVWITAKGYEGCYRKNFSHFVFTTNSDWAVPASADERRFFVLDCGNGWIGETKLFGDMINQMESGGYEAMLYDLMNYRVEVNLRVPPKTDALKTQVELSEPPHASWWREKVEDADGELWETEVSKDRLHDEYLQYCRNLNVRRPVSKSAIFKYLKKQFLFDTVRKIDPLDSGVGRKRFVVLPTLDECLEALSH